MSVREFLRHPFSKRKRGQAQRDRTASEIAKIDKQLSEITDYMVHAPSPMGGYYTIKRQNLKERRGEIIRESRPSRKRRSR